MQAASDASGNSIQAPAQLRYPADPRDLVPWLHSTAEAFSGRDAVLDLSGGSPWRPDEAVSLLARLGVRVVSVCGLPPFPRPLSMADALRAGPWRACPGTSLLSVQHRVRSGTAVRGAGDVELLDAASPGSEVVAGGSVLVMGALGGRVVAGTAAGESAVVVCGAFRPELVSVAGAYLVGDDVDPACVGAPVRVSSSGGSLRVEPIGWPPPA